MIILFRDLLTFKGISEEILRNATVPERPTHMSNLRFVFYFIYSGKCLDSIVLAQQTDLF